MVKNTEIKHNVPKVEFRKWENLDIKSLAHLSAEVRRSEGLGKYTPEQVEEYLNNMNERFPIEIALLATEDGHVVGWMGIERATDNIGEVGRWQPFVSSKTDKQKIAKLLVSNLTDYAKSNDMTRVEVAFGGISEDNLDAYNARRTWYEAEGWSKLEDTNFMVLGPIGDGSEEIEPPVGFDIRPLRAFDNDTIFECYHEAFTTGDARWIFDMTKEQRRQEFDKIFDRSHQINEDASFVILEYEEIAGFILVVSRSDEEEHLESIGIRPKFRGKGLGKTLLGKAIEALRKQEAQNLTLGVDPVNTPAVKLYEQFGFETASRTARYSWKIIDS
jgi:ribosomal protein S18 acetylase RimI-like enzyme